MRVGGSINPYSAHQAGMSALWHDTDYIPEERFETPLVQKGLEDMALPSELHQLPDGVADPFEKMEAVFDVAAAQMERGLKGSTFLNGKPPPEATFQTIDDKPPLPSAVQHNQQVLQSQPGNKASGVEANATFEMRRERDYVRASNEAASITVPKASAGTKTAADKETESAAAAGATSGHNDVLGVAASFVPMAAGQAVQSVVQGPLPAMASQAVNTVGAVITAGNVTATGIAEGLKEEPVIVRRGLKTRV